MAWSYEMLLFSKYFENFNNQLGVIFSRWYSRLTRVIFNYNARVRSSIIEYRKMMLWNSGDELDGDTYFRTWLLFHYVFSFRDKFLWLSSCMLLMLLRYSDDVCINKYSFIVCKNHWISIIFYSAAMVRFCHFFLFSLLLPLLL